jgi:hypothetical protein
VTRTVTEMASSEHEGRGVAPHPADAVPELPPPLAPEKPQQETKMSDWKAGRSFPSWDRIREHGRKHRRENRKEDRVDRRRSENKSPNRRVVVVLRERQGRTLPFVVKSECEGAAIVRERVALGSHLHADDGAHWDPLELIYASHRIDHGAAYSWDGACTNQAESYFSRLRRAEIGQHHHISGPYLHAYAGEMAWREDTRRKPNGTLYLLAAGAALGHPVSRQWAGYWQRGR